MASLQESSAMQQEDSNRSSGEPADGDHEQQQQHHDEHEHDHDHDHQYEHEQHDHDDHISSSSADDRSLDVDEDADEDEDDEMFDPSFGMDHPSDDGDDDDDDDAEHEHDLELDEDDAPPMYGQQRHDDDTGDEQHDAEASSSSAAAHSAIPSAIARYLRRFRYHADGEEGEEEVQMEGENASIDGDDSEAANAASASAAADAASSSADDSSFDSTSLVDSSRLALLLQMGFPQAACIRALLLRRSVEAATNLLLELDDATLVQFSMPIEREEGRQLQRATAQARRAGFSMM